MKQKFSIKWIGSVQPRKQRKYVYNAPLHRRHKFLSVNLSKELRKKHGKRSVPARKGDEVLVMRGSFAKKKGKVLDVNSKRRKISVEGLTKKKLDGTNVNTYFDPSKLQIQSLNLDDAKRLKKQRASEEKNPDKKIKEKKNVSDKSESK